MNIESKIDVNQITEHYLVSNNYSYLYNEFKKRDDLFNYSKTTSLNELINELTKYTKGGINTVKELAMTYALYYCILSKELREIELEKIRNEFLEKDGNIQFEWFPLFKAQAIADRQHKNQTSFTIIKANSSTKMFEVKSNRNDAALTSLKL